MGNLFWLDGGSSRVKQVSKISNYTPSGPAHNARHKCHGRVQLRPSACGVVRCAVDAHESEAKRPENKRQVCPATCELHSRSTLCKIRTVGFLAAVQRRGLSNCGGSSAACARSKKNEFTGWADRVEKLGNLGSAGFRQLSDHLIKSSADVNDVR